MPRVKNATHPNRALKSLIYGKFNSESEMARYLGWPRQKLNRISTEGKEPSLAETVAIADALEISLDKAVSLFLTHMSPNGCDKLVINHLKRAANTRDVYHAGLG